MRRLSQEKQDLAIPFWTKPEPKLNLDLNLKNVWSLLLSFFSLFFALFFFFSSSFPFSWKNEAISLSVTGFQGPENFLQTWSQEQQEIRILGASSNWSASNILEPHSVAFERTVVLISILKTPYHFRCKEITCASKSTWALGPVVTELFKL